MSYMKLIKLLYLADRKSLLTRGRPITADQFFSMDHGPVLSRVLNLITGDERPGTEPIWRTCISKPQNYEVDLINDPGDEELTFAEEQTLREVFAEFGNWDRWDLVEYVHTLPEWEDPKGGAKPIHYETIMKIGGISDDEIESISQDQNSEVELDKILSKYAA